MAGARLSVRRRHGRTLPSAPAPVDSAGERTRYAGAPPGGFGAALPQAEPLAGTSPAYGHLSRTSRRRVSRKTRPVSVPVTGPIRDTPDVGGVDDDEERGGRLLLLGKGAVLAHRLARPLPAESDEREQRCCAARLSRERSRSSSVPPSGVPATPGGRPLATGGPNSPAAGPLLPGERESRRPQRVRATRLVTRLGITYVQAEGYAALRRSCSASKGGVSGIHPKTFVRSGPQSAREGWGPMCRSKHSSVGTGRTAWSRGASLPEGRSCANGKASAASENARSRSPGEQRLGPVVLAQAA